MLLSDCHDIVFYNIMRFNRLFFLTRWLSYIEILPDALDYTFGLETGTACDGVMWHDEKIYGVCSAGLQWGLLLKNCWHFLRSIFLSIRMSSMGVVYKRRPQGLGGSAPIKPLINDAHGWNSSENTCLLTWQWNIWLGEHWTASKWSKIWTIVVYLYIKR